MKLIKKLFGIKTTYAIPSDNGVDITKGKKYKYTSVDNLMGFINDNAGVKIYIVNASCKHIGNSHWKIITE